MDIGHVNNCLLTIKLVHSNYNTTRGYVFRLGFESLLLNATWCVNLYK